MEFFVTNPGQTDEEVFETKKCNLKLYKQVEPRLKANELSVTIRPDPSGPVPLQFAWIRAVDFGETRFLGYVEKPSVNEDKSLTLQCYGAEDQLNRRKTCRYYYDYEEITFRDLFSHEANGGVLPGLLCMANGLLPPGPNYDYVDESKNIVCIRGAGTSSRLGTAGLYSIERPGIATLVEKTALADLQTTDNAYYRDAVDLYVRLDSSTNRCWYNLAGVIADGYKDTRVRLGNLSNPDATLRGALRLTGEKSEKFGDTAIRLIIAHGMQAHIRYARREKQYYAYLDIDESEGRGYPDGLLTLEEGNLPNSPKMRWSVPRDPRVPCLIGCGYGNQHFSAVNWNHKGAWIEDTYDVENGFRDDHGVLKPYTEDQYNSLQADKLWTVESYDTLPLRGGDFIRIKPLNDPTEVLSMITLEKDETGLTTLELGNRTPNFSDAWEALQSSGNIFIDKYLQESFQQINPTAATLRPYDPLHVGVIGSTTFTVPAGALSSGILPRVTAEISLSIQSGETNIGRIEFYYTFGGSTTGFGRFPAMSIGDPIPEMDITDYIVEGSNSMYFVIVCDHDVPGTHSDYNGHPLAVANATIKLWKRLNPL